MFNKYPYTDFHELNLDWFLNQFKELVTDWEDFHTTISEEWAAVQQEWSDTEEAWQTLYNYVHDYFDNLNVQAEVDHKLNEMVADGTMNTLILPYINEYTDDIRVLEARMDTFASLPDGSTAGDAELLDIRVGADGIVYPSAGDAVRGQADKIKEAVSDITELHSRNLFNSRQLLNATGWAENDGEYSGLLKNLVGMFDNTTDGIILAGGFKVNTQYRIVTNHYTNNSPIASGNLANIRVYYTDGTDSGLIYFDVQSSWTSKWATTAAYKTISKIAINYSNSSAGNNTIYLKDIQIIEGIAEAPYDEFEMSAIDLFSRDNDDSMANQISTLAGYSDIDFELGNITINESGWTYTDLFPTYRLRTKEGTTIHLKRGDIIGLTDYTDARYFLGWKYADTYNYRGWLTSDFVVEQEGDYVFLAAHASALALISKYDILDLFFIKRKYSIYDLPCYYRGGMRLHAHQGLVGGQHSDIIANSINAFEEAGKNNIFICETDVRYTSDHEVVCIHNATVDATTNGSGAVADMTLAQVRALRLLRGDGTVSNLLVPTFDEYLQICKKYNMIAAVEVKDSPMTGFMKAVIDKIEAYGMEEQCFFIASVYDVQHFPIRDGINIPVLLITSDSNWDETYDYIKNNNLVGITYSAAGTITKAKIDACHAIRVPFDIHTVSDKATADTYFNLGADMITSDYLTEADWKNS